MAGFEWDEEKAEANAQKHGVDFADAVTVLNDEMAITIPDPGADEEQRFVTVGGDATGEVLVVVYTWRGDRVRLISADARHASNADRTKGSADEERIRLHEGETWAGRRRAEGKDAHHDPHR